jgi:hypothetical protein
MRGQRRVRDLDGQLSRLRMLLGEITDDVNDSSTVLTVSRTADDDTSRSLTLPAGISGTV